MNYSLSGQFIEACDCTVICPCWVDDDPVGGHCTGLIAWTLNDYSTINEIDVPGCTVVSVSTHAGFRRDGSKTTTVLYIDSGEDEPQRKERFEQLAKAFSGDCAGPLGDLAEVSGTVAGYERARITIEEPDRQKGKWGVTVRPVLASNSAADDDPGTYLINATGQPQIFDPEHGNQDPLVLRHTALSHELGVPEAAEDVVAQKGSRLVVNVGALPGGNLDVFGRSGMRGSFEYQWPKDSAPSRTPRTTK